MNKSQLPLDYEKKQSKESDRPMIITIICLVGLTISLLEIAGGFYATYIIGDGTENEWTIYLKIIPAINIICWIGFWTMRKLALGLFIINLIFKVWTQPVDFSVFLYVVFAIIFAAHLNRMTKYI